MVRLKATIVVDTSAILDSLAFVQSLVAGALANGVELLIPREVLKELDRIKDRERVDSQLGSKARGAINWISSVLISQYPEDASTHSQALRGQRYSEAINQDLKNDDSILDCALYNRQTTGRLTILLSNDHNLSNRAVIEGLETLDATSPVTASQVYDAIAQRTGNEMETEDWEPPYWTYSKHEPPQWNTLSPSPLPDPRASPFSPQVKPSVQLHPSNSVLDEEMPDERPPPPPSASNKGMPPPAEGPDMQTRVINSLSALIDWHLRKSFNDEELACLKYTAPVRTSAEMARVLKQFNTLFWDIVPRQTLENFLEAVKRKVIDKQYILSHVALLKALSYNDIEYQRMLAAYF